MSTPALLPSGVTAVCKKQDNGCGLKSRNLFSLEGIILSTYAERKIPFCSRVNIKRISCWSDVLYAVCLHFIRMSFFPCDFTYVQSSPRWVFFFFFLELMHVNKNLMTRSVHCLFTGKLFFFVLLENHQ